MAPVQLAERGEERELVGSDCARRSVGVVVESDHATSEINAPPATAVMNTLAPVAIAARADTTFPIVSKEGRLTAGPASRTASTAASGAPALISASPIGISAKVGSAMHTAIAPITIVTTRGPPDSAARSVIGMKPLRIADASTPSE